MTTATPTAPTPFVPAPTLEGPHQITIISHSNLFYWWPVWAFGFVLAVVTWMEGYVMAVVPRSAVAYIDATSGAFETSAKNEKGEVVTTPHEIKEPSLVIKAPQADDPAHRGVPVQENGQAENPFVRISPHRALGVIFVLVLLMVVVGTNVPMRGMWSVLIIVVAVATTVVFGVLGWLETMLTWFWLLDVRINMAGYFTISTFLFVIWLAALRLFDKQRVHHLHAGPGQGVRRDRRRRAGLQHGRHDVAEAAERLSPPLPPRPGFGRPDRARDRRPGTSNRAAQRAVHQLQAA